MHYLEDDKFSLKNTASLKIRSPVSKTVQLLSTLPTSKLPSFLIRISLCDFSMQLSSAFHYMRFSKAQQHSSLVAKNQLLFNLVVSLHFF